MFEDMFEEEEDFDALADAHAAQGFPVPSENPECLGHDTIQQNLLGLINAGALPHALIFSGPKGIGKSTMAYHLVRYLLKHGAGGSGAEDSLFGDAQDFAATSLDVSADDPVFRKIAAGGHPDFMAVTRAEDERKGGLKETLDVDTIRKITPFLRMTASEGGWRAVIIDDADTMNRNAQNGLLKILEEPPADTVLILIAHRIGALIPTIRSRCRVFHFAALQGDFMKDMLQKVHPDLSSDDLALINEMAAGSLGRALELIEEGGPDALSDITGLLGFWPNWNWSAIHLLAEKLGRAGNNTAYRGFCDGLLWLIESLLRDKARGNSYTADLLKSPALKSFQDHYSLGQLSGFYETLKHHFEQANRSNLDKKQAVLGAFSVFE